MTACWVFKTAALEELMATKLVSSLQFPKFRDFGSVIEEPSQNTSGRCFLTSGIKTAKERKPLFVEERRLGRLAVAC